MGGATLPWAGGPGLYIKVRSCVSQGEPANKQCPSVAPASDPASRFLTEGQSHSKSLRLLTKPQHKAWPNLSFYKPVTANPVSLPVRYLVLRLCLVVRQTKSPTPNANPVSSGCSSPTSVFETVTMCPPGILGGLQSEGQCVPRPFQWTISLRSCIQILLMFSNPFPIFLLTSLPSAHFSRH